tara:strand:+ start:12734 stop:13507 length:774 start_codon:yes stop_codon:yes gene_type:complete
MNIWVLEVGNTRAKWAAFPEANGPSADPVSVEAINIPPDPLHAMATWSAQTAPEDVICITGSGNLDPWLQVAPFAKVMRPGDEVPLTTASVPSNSLGLDRVANAWAVLQGAVTGANAAGEWLVVDAGTCLTMDLVSGGKHLGGTISPGAQLRLNAMHDHAQALPAIQIPLDQESLSHASAVGNSTERAMLAGVLGGMDAEITGKWRALRQQMPNLGLILAGGDAKFLELRTISPKFADAHLTLKGFHALFQHAHDHR